MDETQIVRTSERRAGYQQSRDAIKLGIEPARTRLTNQTRERDKHRKQAVESFMSCGGATLSRWPLTNTLMDRTTNSLRSETAPTIVRWHVIQFETSRFDARPKLAKVATLKYASFGLVALTATLDYSTPRT